MLRINLKKNHIRILLILFSVLIIVCISIIVKNTIKQNVIMEIEKGDLLLSEQSGNSERLLNHALTLENVRDLAAFHWNLEAESQDSINRGSITLQSGSDESETEFIYTEVIEPVYYNSVAYSIKNTYVIPKTIESKQYIFSTQDAKFRGLFSFFSDDLSTKTINIMPTIDSTNDLSPIFSIVNLMCYSEVKAYETASDAYKRVLTTNALWIDYHYLEQGVDANGNVIQKALDNHTVYYVSTHYADVKAILASYIHGKSNRNSLIKGVNFYDFVSQGYMHEALIFY